MYSPGDFCRDFYRDSFKDLARDTCQDCFSGLSSNSSSIFFRIPPEISTIFLLGFSKGCSRDFQTPFRITFRGSPEIPLVIYSGIYCRISSRTNSWMFSAIPPEISLKISNRNPRKYSDNDTSLEDILN